MRPHLLVTAEKIGGLRSLAELRKSVEFGHGRVLWEDIKKRAEADLDAAPIAGASRNFTVVNATVTRVLRHALAFLITGHACYRDAALAQMEASFDPALWPNWHDESDDHPASLPADLRVGQLCLGFGLAYDWLHTALTPEQRRRVVAGVDRCAIQPFLQTVAEGHPQVRVLGNWLTCMVGGVGIAAMAMGEEHAESARLVDLATERLGAYLRAFGPEGEWFESVQYASSAAKPLVAFFSAFRYWSTVHSNPTNGNIIGTYPLPQLCRWMMYMTRPHAREAPLGNAGRPGRPRRIGLSHVPAVAAAARDGVLQWYYLNNLFPTEETDRMRDYALELVWYDHTLKPIDPEGRLPHGRAFSAHTMCVGSRTNWDPRTTPCIVYGKGGAAHEPHGHHDAGQVCIDGYAQPLIIDLGGYDPFCTDSGREIFFHVRGHNILMFDGRHMPMDRPKLRPTYDQPACRDTPPLRARLVNSQFDDHRGGYWILDTADLYEGAREVRRCVVHLNPGVVAVLDTATLEASCDISLRWHTATKCRPDVNGGFVVRGAEGAHIAARVVSLNDGAFAVACREHEETGDGYVEASLRGTACALLTLFCVFEPGTSPGHWEDSNSSRSWYIRTPAGLVDVKASIMELSVVYRDDSRRWSIELVNGEERAHAR